MGMHMGVIAARATPDDLLGALASRIPSWSIVRVVRALGDVPERVGEEAPLIGGSFDGDAFLLDPSQIVSSDSDALVEASRMLDGPVASVGAETTSGTYWLILAGRGSLRRLHWTSLWGLPRPYDLGAPLAEEAPQPLEDIDGVGLIGVLRSLGFRYDEWTAKGPFSVIQAEYLSLESGPHGKALGEFFAAHSTFDPEHLPTPIVVDRGNGGFDLAAAGSRLPDGTPVREAMPAKRGLLGRLMGR
jgi:hypothetical protein